MILNKAFKTALLGSVFALGTVVGASAFTIPQEQIDRLGADVTPQGGGEKAANADGTIPAWDGGITTPPANYKLGDFLVDPFADDQPLYTVTTGNMAEYEDKLTEGYKGMLSAYDSFKMNVYPTRRSCSYPEHVYAATKANVNKAAMADNGGGVVHGIMGAPFPFPSAALEFVWNHTLRYRSFKLQRSYTAASPTREGAYTPTSVNDDALFRWSDPSMSDASELENISIYFKSNTVAPARLAGNVILVHEAMNPTAEARKAWVYSPGTRRVRRAPNIAYDNPLTNGDSLGTSDNFDMYNGAPDRYNWTVKGKAEKFVAYNSYKKGSPSVPLKDLLTPLHLNQDLLRYELHRVWEIEANLRPGTRHVYARRVKYIDEDSWNIVNTALFDARGEIWRVQESHLTSFYQVPLCNLDSEIIYDLQAGRYVILQMKNETKPINYFADELNPAEYTPAAIRRLGTR